VRHVNRQEDRFVADICEARGMEEVESLKECFFSTEELYELGSVVGDKL